MKCYKCMEEKPLQAFSPSRAKKPKGAWCRACSQAYKKANGHKWRDKTNASKRRWHGANKHKARDYEFKRHYGITLEEYEQQAAEQGGLCAICRRPWPGKRPLVVDHNHETGDIRGLLCNGCNVGLGALRDDVGILESAIRYLVKYST